MLNCIISNYSDEPNKKEFTKNSMYEMKAAWFGLLGVLFFISATILGGWQFPSYSHISQLISESYAIGTLYGHQLRY